MRHQSQLRKICYITTKIFVFRPDFLFCRLFLPVASSSQSLFSTLCPNYALYLFTAQSLLFILTCLVFLSILTHSLSHSLTLSLFHPLCSKKYQLHSSTYSPQFSVCLLPNQPSVWFSLPSRLVWHSQLLQRVFWQPWSNVYLHFYPICLTGILVPKVILQTCLLFVEKTPPMFRIKLKIFVVTMWKLPWARTEMFARKLASLFVS